MGRARSFSISPPNILAIFDEFLMLSALKELQNSKNSSNIAKYAIFLGFQSTVEHQTFIIVQHSCYTIRLLLTLIDHTAADTVIHTLKVHTQDILTYSNSSEIRGLHSTKCSSETLQNLLYFMYKKTHVVYFVFHFVQLYTFTF